MPITELSKEIQTYTRACEQLIGAVIRRNTKFSEEELLIVKYYADEVIQVVERTFRSCGSALPK